MYKPIWLDLKNFSIRYITTMLTLFKSLVLSRLDYGSQLWSPHLVKHIDQLEKNTKIFHSTHNWDAKFILQWPFVYLKLHSLQRRRECYCIIYVWKIIEGLVPNFSNPIVCSYSDRRGRSWIVSHVHIGRLGTLAFNSFRWRSIRLFNAMPNHIRCISSCSVLRFKCKLRNIVNLPGRPGFNNSLDSVNYKQWWTPRDDLAVN